MSDAKSQDKCMDESVTLTISKRDLLYFRLGLEQLLSTYTRHDRLNAEILATLGRLPSIDKTAGAMQ